MSTPLRSAINQMIDYYLTQKGAYKVYGYTANIYEKTKSPQKAIEEGLEYAYRIFMEKKGDAVYQQQEAYSEKAGFFQMLLKGQSLQKHSPWGILFEAQGFEKGKREQKGKSVLLTEIAGIAVLIVIYLCFRLFF